MTITPMAISPMAITPIRYALAVAVLLAAAPVSHAESMKVSASLKGTTEVPPTTSKGTGQLTGTYDTATKVLAYDVTYSDLTGPASAAHFHAPAPAGKNAGIEVPITGSLASPIKGEKTLTEQQAKNLADGMTYFNVHTAKNPKGEIRGQVAVAK